VLPRSPSCMDRIVLSIRVLVKACARGRRARFLGDIALPLFLVPQITTASLMHRFHMVPKLFISVHVSGTVRIPLLAWAQLE
jgi:hypothetical protein